MAKAFQKSVKIQEKPKHSQKKNHFLKESFIQNFDSLNDPRIDPSEFQECFKIWVNSITKKLGVEIIAIDGKTLRQSYDRNAQQKALHIVSA